MPSDSGNRCGARSRILLRRSLRWHCRLSNRLSALSTRLSLHRCLLLTGLLLRLLLKTLWRLRILGDGVLLMSLQLSMSDDLLLRPLLSLLHFGLVLEIQNDRLHVFQELRRHAIDAPAVRLLPQQPYALK